MTLESTGTPDHDATLLAALEVDPRPSASARNEIYEQITRRHGNAIVRLVTSSMDGDLAGTDDVVQETFADAFSYLEREGTLPPPGLLGPWLRGVARNRVKAYWRKHRERPAADEAGVAELNDRALSRELEVRDDPDRTNEARRLIAAVQDALSESEQQLFRLRFTQGLPPAEIAEHLGKNSKTVSNRCTDLTKKVGSYFGLLLLVRGDRTNCPELRALLETHERDHGTAFTAELALLVQQHVDTCPTCGDCAVCRTEQRHLLRMAAPVVFPILLSLALRRAISDRIREICHTDEPPSEPPQGPASGPGPRREGDHSPEEGAGRPGGHRLMQKLRLPLAMAVPLLLLLGLWGYQNFPARTDNQSSQNGSTAPVTSQSSNGLPAAVEPKLNLEDAFTGNNSLAFAPNGQSLATVVGDGSSASIRLWDTTNGRPVRTFPATGLGVSAVAFSPDGTLVASGAGMQSGNHVFELRNAETGQVSDTITTLTGQNAVNGGADLAFSPDGGTLAVVSAGATSEDQEVALWDIATRSTIGELTISDGPIYALAFSPDGNTLAVGGQDGQDHGTVRLISVPEKRITSTLTAAGTIVYSLSFSRDGTLATGSSDGVVQLWDTASRQPTTLTGASGMVVTFAPDGRTLAVGRDSLTLWDVADRRITATLTTGRTRHAVGGMAFSPDGATLAAVHGSYDNSNEQMVSLWPVN